MFLCCPVCLFGCIKRRKTPRTSLNEVTLPRLSLPHRRREWPHAIRACAPGNPAPRRRRRAHGGGPDGGGAEGGGCQAQASARAQAFGPRLQQDGRPVGQADGRGHARQQPLDSPRPRTDTTELEWARQRSCAAAPRLNSGASRVPSASPDASVATQVIHRVSLPGRAPRSAGVLFRVLRPCDGPGPRFRFV